jgi:hypothetical protein
MSVNIKLILYEVLTLFMIVLFIHIKNLMFLMNVTDAEHKETGDLMIQSLCNMINSGLICGDIVCCLLHYAVPCSRT